ncbi:helix-turn-helix transcriptional regulator [Mesorhizobium sp. B2-4-14]|uniref:ArsR/SmtB family transcription factor n=1 Tax=Mesorhizobium sp. B2-4-14 TaxID=2589935 RepID=UPI00112A3E99|nr:metalloregulator ArsR/SmtB family transcription factor [Mesorhizobium sp. B2-4-14]TPL06871.1 helix-turn-helix transcriptional regulator [Mesorhizobium sp. B2-4-14]
MRSYVRKRLAEIKADPSLIRQTRPKTAELSRAENVTMAATILDAMGHHRRLLTVIYLSEGEMTVTDLVSKVGGSPASLSHHLKELTELGIIEFRSEGPWRFYSCASATVKAVIEKLDRLALADKLPGLSMSVVAQDLDAGMS